MAPKINGKAIISVVLSVLPLVNAFGTVGNKSLSVPPFLSREPLSPLFVANSQSHYTDHFIKSLDAEMEKTRNIRDKYQQKLSQLESKLQKVEQRKDQYLDVVELGQSQSDMNFTETTTRSAAKAFIWRVIAGTITLLTSVKVSGSIAVAMKIVGSDFFSKAFTMFIGERIMNKSQAGRECGADSTGRSVAKALIWRLFAICNTLSMSLFFAGDFEIASKIAGSDAIFKTALMVFYERTWAKLEWGKEFINNESC